MTTCYSIHGTWTEKEAKSTSHHKKLTLPVRFLHSRVYGTILFALGPYMICKANEPENVPQTRETCSAPYPNLSALLTFQASWTWTFWERGRCWLFPTDRQTVHLSWWQLEGGFGRACLRETPKTKVKWWLSYWDLSWSLYQPQVSPLVSSSVCLIWILWI